MKLKRLIRELRAMRKVHGNCRATILVTLADVSDITTLAGDIDSLAVTGGKEGCPVEIALETRIEKEVTSDHSKQRTGRSGDLSHR